LSKGRSQIKIHHTASDEERDRICHLLIGLGKAHGYAKAIVATKSGTFYAFTKEEAVVFRAAIRLQSLGHVVKVWP
jgi:hypothetical protein